MRHFTRVQAIAWTFAVVSFVPQQVSATPQELGFTDSPVASSPSDTTSATSYYDYESTQEGQSAQADLVTYNSALQPAAPLADADKKAAEAAKKKAAEELKKKVAGAYKDRFYLNDISYLNNPNYTGSNLGEGFKQIPVGDGKLDIGGQYRLRYHNEHNMRGAGLTADFFYTQMRYNF